MDFLTVVIVIFVIAVIGGVVAGVKQSSEQSNGAQYSESANNSARPIMYEIESLTHKIASTKKPVEFFDGYDEVIEKYKLLVKLEGSASFSGIQPSDAIEQILVSKDKDTKEFIEKWYVNVDKSIYRADSEIEKRKVFKKEFRLIAKHYPQMLQDNIELIESLKEQASKNVDFEITEPEPVPASSEFDTMDGREFERFCASLLRNNGFINVETTSGSGDHGVDILAEKDSITYAIQCKRFSSNVGNAAIQEIFSGKEFYKRHVGVVLTNQYFTKNAIEAAARTGIVLWDRNKLQSMMVK